MANAESAPDPESTSDESKYVTVFKQLKDTDTHEEGDRYVSLGQEYDDRYRLNDNEFEPIARPIAVIFAGVTIAQGELTAWCQSDAGKAVLEPYFDGLEKPETTLPDAEIDVPQPIEHTDDGPLLHLRDGSKVLLHAVGEHNDYSYIGQVDQGVAGFENDEDGSLSIHFLDVQERDPR